MSVAIGWAAAAPLDFVCNRPTRGPVAACIVAFANHEGAQAAITAVQARVGLKSLALSHLLPPGGPVA